MVKTMKKLIGKIFRTLYKGILEMYVCIFLYSEGIGNIFWTFPVNAKLDMRVCHQMISLERIPPVSRWNKTRIAKIISQERIKFETSELHLRKIIINIV